jgi:hypothetical protein
MAVRHGYHRRLPRDHPVVFDVKPSVDGLIVISARVWLGYSYPTPRFSRHHCTGWNQLRVFTVWNIPLIKQLCSEHQHCLLMTAALLDDINLHNLKQYTRHHPPDS